MWNVAIFGSVMSCCCGGAARRDPGSAGKDAMGATGSLARAKLRLASAGAAPERCRSFSCKGKAKNRDEIRRDDRWEWKQK